MTPQAERTTLAVARIAGWLAALALVVGTGGGVIAARAHFAFQAREASASRKIAVERIRACRRASGRPMVAWQVCEERVLPQLWLERARERARP